MSGSDNNLFRTPLHEAHLALGARMVPFAGYSMPVSYSGILEEARSVRDNVGIFDISHMGRYRICGRGSQDHIQRRTTNDIATLQNGQAQYSLIPNEAGGIVDDIIVYRLSDDDWLVIVNAANRKDDLAILGASCADNTTFHDQTDDTAMIAVQGPAALSALTRLNGSGLDALARFGTVEDTIADRRVRLCRTGYTGEDGYELIVSAEDADGLWRSLLEVGAVPCGLGARDALRIEAGYPLYGNEINQSTTPVEAGLMFAVKLDKGDFIGRARILEAKEKGPSRRLMGFVMEDRAIPRAGYEVMIAGQPLGVVTSGALAVTRNTAVGMAYIQADHARRDAKITIDIRGTPHPGVLVAKSGMLLKSRTGS